MRSLTELRFDVTYDISPAVDGRLKVWPGDTEPAREVQLDIRRGDNITLSTLRATVHLGAHADAPSHYSAAGPTIDRMPIDLYVGHCQVIRARARRGERIGPRDLEDAVGSERVLIASGTYPDPGDFNQDFAGLEPALIQHLAERGVRLVGVDTPSVDLFDSKELPAHQACLRSGIAILEGLVLAQVPSGFYELIALPLKLVGFDASPVRAVLRRI